jgi:hypothetical protein
MSQVHSQQTIADGLHIIQSLGPYTNEAGRIAGGAAAASTDIGRVAQQTDTGAFWILVAIGLWAQIGGGVPVKTIAGTAYTFALADADCYQRTTNAAAVALTVPPNSTVPFPIGTTIPVRQSGAGQVTLTPGAGVTLLSSTTLLTKQQHATVSLTKVATDTWDVTGERA